MSIKARNIQNIKMNIGKESAQNFIESNGIAILTQKLQEAGKIKCHFSENDKTPNTDGFFVIVDEKFFPIKEIHVQIKSTTSIIYSGTDGQFIHTSIDDEIDGWLEKTFRNQIINKVAFIPFSPDDALFEIVFNFLDELAKNKREYRKLGYDIYKDDLIPTNEAYQLIFSVYPYSYANKEIQLLQMAITELKKRDIEFIHRIWRPRASLDIHIINCFCGLNVDDMKANNIKLFTSLPRYYNEFIVNLFGQDVAKKYQKDGKYFCTFDTHMCGNFLTNNYQYIVSDSLDFEVHYVDEITDDLKASYNYHICGNGFVNASFVKNEPNILNNLMSILYDMVCKIYHFDKETLHLQADF